MESVNTFIEDHLATELLANIQQQKSQVNKLRNIKQVHHTVQQLKNVYECLERIKISYDFASYKIIDFVALSEAVKQTNILQLLSPDIRKVPAINQNLIKINNAKSQLTNQTTDRFNEAFEIRDTK